MGLNTEDYSRDFDSIFNPIMSDYGLVKTLDTQAGLSFLKEFTDSAAVRLHFNYDIRENSFYFYVIWGMNTPFPNEADSTNIRTLEEVYQAEEAGLDMTGLRPDSMQYRESLRRHADLLRRHMKSVLARTVR